MQEFTGLYVFANRLKSLIPETQIDLSIPREKADNGAHQVLADIRSLESGALEAKVAFKYNSEPITKKEEKTTIFGIFDIDFKSLNSERISIIQEELKKLEGQEFISDERYNMYLNRTKDNEDKLLQLYGEAFLPGEDASIRELEQVVGTGMRRFWTDFYLQNKDLFSL